MGAGAFACENGCSYDFAPKNKAEMKALKMHNCKCSDAAECGKDCKCSKLCGNINNYAYGFFKESSVYGLQDSHYLSFDTSVYKQRDVAKFFQFPP